MLAAAIVLPVGAGLAALLLVTEPDPPRVPAVVRIGEAPPTSLPPEPGVPPTTAPSVPVETQDRLPPPPPVDDDDDDDDDHDDG